MNRSQKKLKFNRQNFFTTLVLLILVNLVGPGFVDPQTEAGSLFYFFVALMTAFMFPFLEVIDDESQS